MDIDADPLAGQSMGKCVPRFHRLLDCVLTMEQVNTDKRQGSAIKPSCGKLLDEYQLVRPKWIGTKLGGVEVHGVAEE